MRIFFFLRQLIKKKHEKIDSFFLLEFFELITVYIVVDTLFFFLAVTHSEHYLYPWHWLNIGDKFVEEDIASAIEEYLPEISVELH